MLKKLALLLPCAIILLLNTGCVTNYITKIGVVYEVPDRVKKAVVTPENELVLDVLYKYTSRNLKGEWVVFDSSEKVVVIHERAFYELLDKSDSQSRNPPRSMTMVLYDKYKSTIIPEEYYQAISSEERDKYFSKSNTIQNLKKHTTIFSQEFTYESLDKNYNLIFYKPEYNFPLYYSNYPMANRAKRKAWSYPILIFTPVTMAVDTVAIAASLVLGVPNGLLLDQNIVIIIE